MIDKITLLEEGEDKYFQIPAEYKQEVEPSSYDKVWSFSFGLVGGISTVAWYTGYATSAIALGPVSVPMTLGAGVACLGYAVHSTVSEPKSLTTQDKMVLAGGSVGAASVTLGIVGIAVPKLMFGMTATTGPAAVPLFVGGAIAYGIAYHYDQNDRLEEAKPAFYAFAAGALPTTYFCLKSNAEEITKALQGSKMMGGDLNFVETYHRAEKSVLQKNGAFMNSHTFYKLLKKGVQPDTTNKVFKKLHGVVKAGEEFATQQSYAEYLEEKKPDGFERVGRKSWANSALEVAQHLADEGDSSVDLLAGVVDKRDSIF